MRVRQMGKKKFHAGQSVCSARRVKTQQYNDTEETHQQPGNPLCTEAFSYPKQRSK